MLYFQDKVCYNDKNTRIKAYATEKGSRFTMARKIIGLGILIMMILSLSACGKSHGIPDGTYHSYVSGTILQRGLEYAWQIRNGQAEYLYMKYKVIKEDGKIYFSNEHSDTKYEVKYDKKEKVLFVYMPFEDTVKPYLFKKITLFSNVVHY